MHMNDPKINELRDTITKYKRLVYSIAVTQLDNKYEADDVFQEVFLLYYQKELSFADETARRTWLIRTALNITRQFNRAKWHRHTDKSADIDSLNISFASPQDKELMTAISELPHKIREAVCLHYLLGLSVRETGELLKVTPTAVSMRLIKARKLLKAWTEGEE